MDVSDIGEKIFHRTTALFATVAVTLFASLSCSFAAPPATLPALDGIRRIVFLGDSITYSGQYIDYLDAYLTTRFPEQRWELLDLGLPSETVSGLSEPGHAGGKFPRPDLHERLDRVLAKTKPDLVVACYGMNDGIYHPFSEERFKKYQDGIKRLREKVLASGAKMLHVTPPTFDPVPIKAKVLPAGREVYEQPFEGYNQVLDRYSEWLLGQRQLGWDVVDLHSVMNRHLAERRKTEPGYILAKDGVHANATGHWLIAQEILKHWKAPAEVDKLVGEFSSLPVSTLAWDKYVELDPWAVNPKNVRTLRTWKPDWGGFYISWKTRLPMPMDSQWDKLAVLTENIHGCYNLHQLVIKNAPFSNFFIFEDEEHLCTIDAKEFAKGINLTNVRRFSTNQRGDELLKFIRQRGRILADAWLIETGHQRPGMKQGLPLIEAQMQAEELTRETRKLATPIILHLRFRDAGYFH